MNDGPRVMPNRDAARSRHRSLRSNRIEHLRASAPAPPHPRARCTLCPLPARGERVGRGRSVDWMRLCAVSPSPGLFIGCACGAPCSDPADRTRCA